MASRACGARKSRLPPRRWKLAAPSRPFKIQCSDVETDHAAVKSLFDAMMEARKKAGQPADPNSFDSFKAFVKKKTDQIRGESGCPGVEYSVEVQNGQVRLKAKAKS